MDARISNKVEKIFTTDDMCDKIAIAREAGRKGTLENEEMKM